MPNDPTATLVAAATVKLPQFWVDQPEVWFCQAEAHFSLKQITVSRTKFDHVVAVLPQKVCAAMLDVIQLPHATTLYEHLKDCLLSAYTISSYQRASYLVHQPALGDRKPSQLMADMLALLPPDTKPDFLFNYLFLERLPADVRSHLVKSSIQDQRELAAFADSLMSSTAAPSFNVHTAQDDYYEDDSEMAAVSDVRSSSSRFGSRRRDSSPRRSLCWYHEKYGRKATKCESPSSWRSGNGRTGGRR